VKRTSSFATNDVPVVHVTTVLVVATSVMTESAVPSLSRELVLLQELKNVERHISDAGELSSGKLNSIVEPALGRLHHQDRGAEHAVRAELVAVDILRGEVERLAGRAHQPHPRRAGRGACRRFPDTCELDAIARSHGGRSFSE
jgi:hypothetical protein